MEFITEDEKNLEKIITVLIDSYTILSTYRAISAIEKAPAVY